MLKKIGKKIKNHLRGIVLTLRRKKNTLKTVIATLIEIIETQTAAIHDLLVMA